MKQAQQPSDPSSTLTAFISGPLEVSNAYFHRYYRRDIDRAIRRGHTFVIGPVSGIDALAFNYLLSQGVDAERIKIYMAGFELASRPSFASQTRKRLGQDAVVEAKTASGEDAKTTWDRDAAMTRDSDYDILRFRTEWEQKSIYGASWRPRVSNTERNWRRRRGEDAEGREIEYISHVDAGETKAGTLLPAFLLRLWKPSTGVDEAARCDGRCIAHRDVVFAPLLCGKSAFGFGRDGMRTL